MFYEKTIFRKQVSKIWSNRSRCLINSFGKIKRTFEIISNQLLKM